MGAPMEHSTESSKKRAERSALRRVAKTLELIGGIFLCALVIATPWLFGTTEEWSVRWMNLGSCATGLIFALAAILNRIKGGGHGETKRERITRYVFLALNLAVLGFCLVALVNARATFSLADRSFDYTEKYNRSLPTTYDAGSTRATLFSLGAYFLVFWSTRSWLLARERRAGALEDGSIVRNKRFQALGWVLALNGFAIALQGIFQRSSNSSKLLWLRESYFADPLGCFGPFSYRGNAADYLNLIWPVALGFWWIMSRERRRKMGSARLFTDGPELLLIPAALVIIAGCLISLSRGGAVVAMVMLLLIFAIFSFQKSIALRTRIGLMCIVTTAVFSGWFLGWDALSDRLKTSGMGDLSGREEIYQNARLMAQDFPMLGTGPGSFSSVYHMYRQKPGDTWHGFLHDDWMETRVTFGWVGFGLILLNVLVLFAWIGSPGRPAVSYVFQCCLLLSLAGALVHAKFDFPFQTYSIFFTFAVICALASAMSPSRK
jgi:O-antigen ligase